MSVVFILPSLRQGGSEKVFSQLVKNINKHKCNLIVVEKVTKEDLDRYNLPQEKVISLNKKRVISSLFDLYKELKKLNVKIVFSTHTHLNLILLMVAHFYNAKYIVRESSVFTEMSKFGNKTAFLELLMKFYYPRADNIICQSKDIKQDLSKLFKVPLNKLIIISNGIEVESIPKKKSLMTNMPLEIVHIARFKEVKGHDRLIEILKRIKREFRITLIGDGPLKDNFVKEINKANLQDNVRFTGEIKNPANYLIKSDLYIQTSYVEGFPNAMLEACAVGLPVIAYDVKGGTKEIINKHNGILIKDVELLQKNGR